MLNAKQASAITICAAVAVGLFRMAQDLFQEGGRKEDDEVVERVVACGLSILFISDILLILVALWKGFSQPEQQEQQQISPKF